MLLKFDYSHAAYAFTLLCQPSCNTLLHSQWCYTRIDTKRYIYDTVVDILLVMYLSYLSLIKQANTCSVAHDRMCGAQM